MDDGIFFHPNKHVVDEAIAELKESDLDLEDQGNLSDYLGIHFEFLQSGDIQMTQPHLINQIIANLGLDNNSNAKTTPAQSTVILKRGINDPPGKEAFNYKSIVGKLNYLEKGSRPDIAYAVHQCARFMEKPKQVHYDAVKRLERYLLHTKDKGLVPRPDPDRSLDTFADADFSGNWNKHEAADDPSTAKSRTGYIIKLAACSILWASKLQTQIALSTTEAEYIALSQALRETIPIMNLLKEIRRKKISTISTVPNVYKAFEDNSGALELARSPKMRPRSKHINIVYHHLRSYVKNRTILLYPIRTDDQQADIFTKPLPEHLFIKIREMICRWTDRPLPDNERECDKIGEI